MMSMSRDEFLKGRKDEFPRKITMKYRQFGFVLLDDLKKKIIIRNYKY